jgi:hypothetical protein
MHPTLGSNAVIYYTALSPISSEIEKKWNTDLKLRFFPYHDCLFLIQKNFNLNISTIFEQIQPGWKKVLLFKLSIMYLKTGIVVDPNVYPLVAPETLYEGGITTYMTVSNEMRVNMMMMANFSQRKSMLFLSLLLSYVLNPENFDLYSALSYNIGTLKVKAGRRYEIEEVKCAILVGKSSYREKSVTLLWFPIDELHDIRCQLTIHRDEFKFRIQGNTLYVTHKSGGGWEHDLVVDIVLYTNEVLYTLTERVAADKYEIVKDDKVVFIRQI